MGHVQSKRRRDRRRKKLSNLSDIMKNVTTGDSENIHHVAGHRIYRDSVNLDQLSNSSGYFSSNEPSPNSLGNQSEWLLGTEVINDNSVGQCDRNDGTCSGITPWEELCTYKGFPIEDHSVLTKLQNEQNTRLEDMELRMMRIRQNAQQAYERKKFAHLFRAKKEHGQTDVLLQEARDLLQQNIEMCNSEKETMEPPYTGEIIPVQIVEESRETTDEQDEGYLPLARFGPIQISEPIMLLILPFLLPLFIIVAIIRGLSQTLGWKQTSVKLKSRRNS